MTLGFAITFLGTLTLAHAPSSILLRLHPGNGRIIKYNLHIDRITTGEHADLASTSVVSQSGSSVTFNVTLDRLALNGVDRTAEMRRGAKLTAVLPWDDRSRRAGNLEPLEPSASTRPDLLAYMQEAGLYLSNYPVGPVQVGSEWSGETTATGGCTACRYRVAGIRQVNGKIFVDLDVTNIAMYYHDQVGVMKMVVDTSLGIPTYVAYTARNKQNGRISQFTETLISAK